MCVRGEYVQLAKTTFHEYLDRLQSSDDQGKNPVALVKEGWYTTVSDMIKAADMLLSYKSASYHKSADGCRITR